LKKIEVLPKSEMIFKACSARFGCFPRTYLL